MIEWSDPPSPLADRCDEREYAAALTATPGRFALVAVYPTRMAAESLYRRVIRGAGPWVGGLDAWVCRIRQDQTPMGVPQWRVYVTHIAAVPVRVAW